jgi:hypothetical protein|tara:strand:- start:22 stop:303 length:282 start_codon:yes stop_codon:yes gene_type:complete
MTKETNVEPLWNGHNEDYGFKEESYVLTITLTGEVVGTGITEEHALSKIQKMFYSQLGASEIIDLFVKVNESEVGISFKAKPFPHEDWMYEDV